MKTVITIFLFSCCFLFSPLFHSQSIFVKLVIILNTVFLWTILQKPKLSKFYISAYLLLAMSQISSTRLYSVYQSSGYDKYLLETRLNSYPPRIHRLGNIVENYLDSSTINQVQKNLFDSLDFIDYFKNFYPTYLFIAFFIGLINAIKKPNPVFLNPLFGAILLLAIISPKGLSGPFILIPFINILISHYSIES